MDPVWGTIAIAAALAALTGIGAGVGLGVATGKAAVSVARQPEASGKIMSVMLLGAALAEATAIYGLVVALMLIGKMVVR
jgi:F-type H+-transporting ATPase subunit c